MAKLDKLKKKAAEFEQKRQFDKALSTYEQVLREQGTGEDADVALLNRVGDLQLRHGRTEDALRSYETAVELYADRGFHNNAIALCQKILRQDPHRAHIQFQLGRISAVKGIRGDARHHFRTYARMMERTGRLDEAVQALDDFAAHATDADDALLAAADLLSRHGKADDALPRLKRALELCEAASRRADAQVVIEQICAIDPSFEAAPPSAFAGDADIVGADAAPRSARAGARRTGISSDLVLIDPHAIDHFSAAPAAAESRHVAPDRTSVEALPVNDDVVVESHIGDATSGSLGDPATRLGNSGDDAADGIALMKGAEFDTAGPPAAELLAGFEKTALDGEGGGAELEHPLPFSMTDLLLGERSVVAPDERLEVAAADQQAPRDTSAINDALFGGEPAHALEGEPEIAFVEPISLSSLADEPTELTPVEIVQPELLASGPVSPEVFRDMERGAGAFELVDPNGDAVAETQPADGEEQGPPLEIIAPPSASPAAGPALTAPIDSESDVPVPVSAQERAGVLPSSPERTTAPAQPAPRPEPAAGADFVNLGDLLRSEDSPRSTRMVAEERAPTGDEQADFVEMLRKFKQGVADNVDHEDFDSHYDLGVAYKEMGLLDEAIAAFQRALRGPHHRVRIYEALGQCFLDKGQHAVANSVLQRALGEGGSDDQQLVGVLYLLGRASEAMDQKGEALRYYQRVFAVDIEFNDVAERIGMVEQVMQ